MIEHPRRTSRVDIALDIDGILAFSDIHKDAQPFFLREGLIITAIKTHYLVPRVFAFIRFLFSMENVRISFFSSGAKERNEAFVEELLKKALGPDRYLEVKDEVKILSRNDLKSPSREERIIQQKKYSGHEYHFATGQKMKSLKLIVDEGETTENSILVEDDISYTTTGEEECLLYVPETSGRIIDKFYYIPRYTESAYGLLPCKRRDQIPSETLVKGSEVTVIQKKYNTALYFKNETSGEISCCILDARNDKQLIKALVKFNKKNKKLIESEWEYDESIRSMIHEKVKSCGGQTQKLKRKLNRIYYVAGMIFHAIHTARAEETTVSKILSSIQFKQTMDNPPKYEPLHYLKAESDSFYYLGLKILREHDIPTLTFTSTHSIQQVLKDPVTAEEETLLEQYRKNQDTSCSIM